MISFRGIQLMLAVSLAALGALALPVSAAAALTDELVVNVAGGPAVSPEVAQPTGMTPPEGCTLLGGFPPTGVRCELTEQVAEKDRVLTGSVQTADGSLTGSISLTCTMAMSLPLVVVTDLTASTLTYESLNGTGRQDCTWVITMSDGSGLTGELGGSMALALVAPENTSAAWTGTFNVTVLGGSGRWAGRAGTGTFTQSESIALPSTVARRRAHARVGEADASRLGLTLAARAPRVQFRTPKVGASVKLRALTRAEVFTAPGASCTFSARKARSTVTKQLGTGRDGRPADGKVTSTKRISSLGLGSWTITAACTSGTRTGRATRLVRVIR